MNTKTKKKLCWNCEGNVSLEDELCPYCGVSLDVTPIAGTNIQDMQLIPPYKLSTNPVDQPIPTAPYPSQEVNEEPPLEKTETYPNDVKTFAIPLALFLLGSVLILFSLILLIFSDSQGILTLNWNGNYWFIYLLIGIPLTYLGWRVASNNDD